MTKKDYCLIAGAIAKAKASIEAETVKNSTDLVGQIEQVRAVSRVARTLAITLKHDYKGSYAFSVDRFLTACGFPE